VNKHLKHVFGHIGDFVFKLLGSQFACHGPERHDIVPYGGGTEEKLLWYHTAHDEWIETCPQGTNLVKGKIV